MREFDKWTPAQQLAAAVELRQPGTLKLLEDFMENGPAWFAAQERLGAFHDWTLEQTVDHVLDNVGRWASQLTKPQAG